MGLVPDSDIDSYACVLFLESGILSDLPVKWQRHAYFMPALAQLMRQRIHHIDQRAGALQRRSLCADHENSHLEEGLALNLER